MRWMMLLWLMASVYGMDRWSIGQDGYFSDGGRRVIPVGFAYQTWNRHVYAQQTPEQIRWDMERMRDMGATTLRVEMTWNDIERAPGVYDWSKPDLLISMARDAGLRLFVLIGYQYAPAWWKTVHPTWMAVGWSTRGNPGSPNAGGFQPSDVWNYQHPDAVDAFAGYMHRIVSRYAGNPVVAGWIIGNEFAFFDLWEDRKQWVMHRMLGYDAWSSASWSAWLMERYASIDRLNAAWGTSWPSFADIIMPGDLDYAATMERGHEIRQQGIMDLVRWRSERIGYVVARGAQAVRRADAGALIAYAQVGGTFDKYAGHETCDTPEAILEACRSMPDARLDFWAINNYPLPAPGEEGRSLAFGIHTAKQRTGLPVLVTETGISTNDLFFPDNATWGHTLIPSLGHETMAAGAMGVHWFHWSDRDDFIAWGPPLNREAGFGIVTQDRRIKASSGSMRDTMLAIQDPGYPMVNLSEEGSPVLVLGSPTMVVDDNRYRLDIYGLWGTIIRMGYHPRYVQSQDLAAWQASIPPLIVPGVWALSDDEMEHIRDYASHGASVIMIGTAGTHDEHGRRRMSPWPEILDDRYLAWNGFTADMTSVPLTPRVESEQFIAIDAVDGGPWYMAWKAEIAKPASGATVVMEAMIRNTDRFPLVITRGSWSWIATPIGAVYGPDNTSSDERLRIRQSILGAVLPGHGGPVLTHGSASRGCHVNMTAHPHLIEPVVDHMTGDLRSVIQPHEAIVWGDTASVRWREVPHILWSSTASITMQVVRSGYDGPLPWTVTATWPSGATDAWSGTWNDHQMSMSLRVSGKEDMVPGTVTWRYRDAFGRMADALSRLHGVFPVERTTIGTRVLVTRVPDLAWSDAPSDRARLWDGPSASMAWSIRWRDGSGHHGRVITMDPPVTVMIPSSADAVWIGPDPEPLSRHDLASMPTFLGALDVVHAYDAWSITWPSAFDEHVAWMWWSSDGSGASGHQYASARSGIRLSGLPHGSYEVVAISSHGSARASFVVDPDQTSWSWREYWWPCTEGAGEIIHERMVGDDARAHAPSWHQDSLFFNGITDAIDMPVAPFLLRQESGSLSWWVCLADPYDDGDQVMWSTKTIWNDPWGWEILYRYDPLDGMGRLVFLGSDYGPFVDVPVDPRDMTGWVRVTSAWRADPDTAFGIASLAINDRVLARDMRIRGPWAFPWSIPPRIGGPAGGSDERRRLTGYMADVELGPRERFDVVRLRGDEKPDPVPVFPHVPNRWTAGALIITVQAPGMRVTDHVGRSGTRFSVDPGLPWSLTLHPMMSQ